MKRAEGRVLVEGALSRDSKQTGVKRSQLKAKEEGIHYNCIIHLNGGQLQFLLTKQRRQKLKIDTWEMYITEVIPGSSDSLSNMTCTGYEINLGDSTGLTYLIGGRRIWRKP